MVLDFGDDIVRRGVLDPSQNRDRERTFQLSHEHSHGRSAFYGMDDRLGKKESPLRQAGPEERPFVLGFIRLCHGGFLALLLRCDRPRTGERRRPDR